MGILSDVYRTSLALLTDLYQLTMAYGYWKTGMGEREAAFNLFFRRNPFGGGYTVACGLSYVIEFLRDFRFDQSDLAYLSELRGGDGNPLLEDAFLRYLESFRLRCDIDAVPEGSVVFPYEPLIRVKGPLLHAQLLETPLLNLINFQTLVATKAARVVSAARGDPVLEFGLRRAQGIDGGITASRAAYVGGCAATSNVLAGKIFGIPVRGTHAHSWVMAFPSEEEAFRAYAEAMPNNCVFLVDTYNTLEGVKRAVAVAKELSGCGLKFLGIRLDSGDLAYLSIEARRILDENGFKEAKIFASNDLDEHLIQSLKEQGAKVGVWGVGTKLATAYDQPALGGVYKLVAIKNAEGRWEYKIKLSEQAAKINIPGLCKVRRYVQDGTYVADCIYSEDLGVEEPCVIVDPADPTRRKRIAPGTQWEELLIPIARQGELVSEPEPLNGIRERAKEQLERLHPTIRRLTNPHIYPVGLENRLNDLRMKLILEARGF